MHLLAALICMVLGGIGGVLAPGLIRSVPDIAPDPNEAEGDFPEAIPFARLGARHGLSVLTVILGAVLAGVLGAVFGLVWGVALVVVALPYALALAVIDYVTWFLPDHLIRPAAVSVGIVVIAAAIGVDDRDVVLRALSGGFGLLAWYGVFWLISPTSLAFGDVKLAGLLGLILGPWGISPVVLSVLAAGLVSLVALIPMRRTGNAINQGGSTSALKAHVPFGPSMLLGAWIALLVGHALTTV